MFSNNTEFFHFSIKLILSIFALVSDLREAVLKKKAEMTVYKVSGVLQSHENYLRWLTAIDHAGLELYFQAFHNADQGFPMEPEKLYKHLLTIQEDFDVMKANGELNETEYATLFPASKETYTQDFGFELFKKIITYFHRKHGVDKEQANLSFLDSMDDLHRMYSNKTLVPRLQKSIDAVDEKWNELVEVLKKLHYDPVKVEKLKTVDDLDENKKFRFALLRSEISVLLYECDDCMKTLKTNLLALNKLKGNFEMALSESKENNNNDKQKTEKDLEGLNNLTEELLKNQNKLSLHVDELKALLPAIKFWRQKNIEGDIIVCDETLSQLRNEIREQTHRVGDLFNTVSFDICRIKERTSSVNGDFRVISPTHSERVH